MNVSFGSAVDWMESLIRQLAFERTGFALDSGSDAMRNDCFGDYLLCNIYRHRSPRNFCERERMGAHLIDLQIEFRAITRIESKSDEQAARVARFKLLQKDMAYRFLIAVIDPYEL